MPCIDRSVLRVACIIRVGCSRTNCHEVWGGGGEDVEKQMARNLETAEGRSPRDLF